MLRRYLDKEACEKAIYGICKGDRDALSVIYERMHRPIYSLAISICGNKYDAEDVLQDTLCEVVRSAPAYRGGNARAWILGIARNLSLRTVEKRHAHAEIEDMENAAVVSSPKDALFDSYALSDAMAQLDEAEREVVVMKVIAGLTHKEIAALHGCSVDAAKRIYYRALNKLKVYFDVQEK